MFCALGFTSLLSRLMCKLGVLLQSADLDIRKPAVNDVTGWKNCTPVTHHLN